MWLKKTVHINFIIIVLFCCNAFAAEKINYDEEQIVPRSLPQIPSQVYTDRDFVYDEPVREKNFLERFWDLILRKIYKFLNNLFNWDLRADSLSGRRALWFTLTGILVVMLIVGVIFGVKKFGKTIGKNDKMLISVDEVERNLAEIDIDQLISTAVDEKNYRLAVRFCYLKMLKKLSEKQIIDYQYQKTNYEYAYEIQNPDLHLLFLEISSIFDYCWYGNHQTSEQDYVLVSRKTMKMESD